MCCTDCTWERNPTTQGKGHHNTPSLVTNVHDVVSPDTRLENVVQQLEPFATTAWQRPLQALSEISSEEPSIDRAFLGAVTRMPGEYQFRYADY